MTDKSKRLQARNDDLTGTVVILGPWVVTMHFENMVCSLIWHRLDTAPNNNCTRFAPDLCTKDMNLTQNPEIAINIPSSISIVKKSVQNEGRTKDR